MGETPLSELVPFLRDRRGFESLRHGYKTYGTECTPYASVEQVAAATDWDLLELKNVGPLTVRRIRLAIAALSNSKPITISPRRDDTVAAWLKRKRDEHGHPESASAGAWDARTRWDVINDLLDECRDHADTGVPLDPEVVGPHDEQ